MGYLGTNILKEERVGGAGGTSVRIYCRRKLWAVQGVPRYEYIVGGNCGWCRGYPRYEYRITWQPAIIYCLILCHDMGQKKQNNKCTHLYTVASALQN